MSATLYSIDARNYAVFFIDSTDDLTDLPTLDGEGKGELSTVKNIKHGSVARLTNTDDKFYRLTGSNEWVEVKASGGGGGGGDQVDYNTQVYNKPTINGKTVEGNVTSDDIDVAPEPTVQGEALVI